MSILALYAEMNDLVAKVHHDHPESKGLELVDNLIAEVKKPGNERFIEACIRCACLDACDDYRAQEGYHQEREAKGACAPEFFAGSVFSSDKRG